MTDPDAKVREATRITAFNIASRRKVLSLEACCTEIEAVMREQFALGQSSTTPEVRQDAYKCYDVLVAWFNTPEGFTAFGSNGDYQGWSPAQTAIEAMKECIKLRSVATPEVAQNDGTLSEALAALRAIPTELVERLRARSGERITGLASGAHFVTDSMSLDWDVRDALLTSQARVAAAEAAKDGAYLERNQVVAGFAMLAMTLGYRAGRARTAIEDWEPKWHGCVYIDLPTGQVSWHYHDSQDHVFEWLPTYDAAWDGHDTPEKYRRVLAITEDDPPNVRAESAEAKIEARENLCRQVCDNYANKTSEAEARVQRSIVCNCPDTYRSIVPEEHHETCPVVAIPLAWRLRAESAEAEVARLRAVVEAAREFEKRGHSSACNSQNLGDRCICGWMNMHRALAALAALTPAPPEKAD